MYKIISDAKKKIIIQADPCTDSEQAREMLHMQDN